MPARFEDSKAIKDTGKALLVDIVNGEQQIWVPQSVIHADSDVFDAKENAEGTLVVEEWWAKKEGLV